MDSALCSWVLPRLSAGRRGKVSVSGYPSLSQHLLSQHMHPPRPQEIFKLGWLPLRIVVPCTSRSRKGRFFRPGVLSSHERIPLKQRHWLLTMETTAEGSRRERTSPEQSLC